ncbi:F0F1 ATP synthase subunit delta [Marinihelvus fidelis]|uniref:ATP synthase subunit delta n=1 Tax=Marinihelvus fidelis TaxID=2613842 RepID=A0A5N0T9E9_9GAMM|nr:F0F1 ATP synthase subunit delta [Marinihelvus fidelis]KAA9131655.1 F0F1 ATP synthase subunit delta [Marinihelvus fidelis]
MSNETTLARPYAKAAFGVAKDAGDLAGWGAALAAASAAVSEPKMAAWLGAPSLDRAKAVGMINDAVGGDEKFGRFLAVLAENDRLPLLPEITAMFGQLREAAEGRLEVKVVSAVALDDDQAARMKTALAKRYDREIDLANEVDASVLGGAVIYAGDEVIDGSLKGRLDKLSATLNRV